MYKEYASFVKRAKDPLRGRPLNSRFRYRWADGRADCIEFTQGNIPVALLGPDDKLRLPDTFDAAVPAQRYAWPRLVNSLTSAVISVSQTVCGTYVVREGEDRVRFEAPMFSLDMRTLKVTGVLYHPPAKNKDAALRWRRLHTRYRKGLQVRAAMGVLSEELYRAGMVPALAGFASVVLPLLEADDYSPRTMCLLRTFSGQDYSRDWVRVFDAAVRRQKSDIYRHFGVYKEGA